MTNALRQLKAVAEDIKPEPGIAHRRLPGSVTIGAALWAVLAGVALWSGIDVFSSNHPETAGLNSGDITPSAAASSSISTSTLMTLIGGIVVLIGVALLLIGLTFATYVLYVAGTSTVITLAFDSPLMSVSAMALLLIASSVLLGRSAREYLAPESKRDLFVERPQRVPPSRSDGLRTDRSAVDRSDAGQVRVDESVDASAGGADARPAEVGEPDAAAAAPARRRPSPKPRAEI